MLTKDSSAMDRLILKAHLTNAVTFNPNQQQINTH